MKLKCTLCGEILPTEDKEKVLSHLKDFHSWDFEQKTQEVFFNVVEEQIKGKVLIEKRFGEAWGFYSIIKTLNVDSDKEFWQKIEIPSEVYEFEKAQMRLDSNYEELTDSELEQEAYRAVNDRLTHHSFYYEPDASYCSENLKTALKCGLIPFKYDPQDKDLFLLALGGSGENLTPKLDAFMALMIGKISHSSMLFIQLSWFDHVVGAEVTQEVIDKLTL